MRKFRVLLLVDITANTVDEAEDKAARIRLCPECEVDDVTQYDVLDANEDLDQWTILTV